MRSLISHGICGSGRGGFRSAQEWIPEYFEFSFGLSDEGRDPRSVS